MKKAFSRIFGQFARTAQRYNAGHRALRELDKQKTIPVAAPRHESNLKYSDQLEKDKNEFIDKSNVVDDVHDSHLKQVYVTSTEPEPIKYNIRRSSVEKPLPVNRESTYFEMGFCEPKLEDIPKGKITLRQILLILAQHRANSEEYTVEKLAKTYKLDEDVLRTILKHFQTFEMFVPNLESQANTQILQRAKLPPGTINVTTKYPEMVAILQPDNKKRVLQVVTEFLHSDKKRKEPLPLRVEPGKEPMKKDS